MSEQDKQTLVSAAVDGVKEQFTEIGNSLLKKTPPWAVAIVSIMLTGIGCGGAFLYANADTILRWQQQSLDVEHLKADHDDCHVKVVKLEAEIDQLKDEVASLRRQISSN